MINFSMKSLFLIVSILSLLVSITHCLKNGLALAPPMGWLTWERFRCNVDCDHDPDNCIGEKLIKDMADRMVSDGFKDLGYEYVNIDDCWLAHTRDADGKLQPDPKRFPSGIKGLADYVHKKGLKLGIYEDYGTLTCAGYPGSQYYLQLDAETYAEWGIDMIKIDGCHSDPKTYSGAGADYPPIQYWLQRSGRPILYSSVLPLHQYVKGIMPNYTKVARENNIARNYNDITDSWDSLQSIIQFYGDNKGNFAQLAGPGFYNDPDELIIGNYGLSYEQERVQMGMWAMMASPLLMSVDLRNIRNQSKELLQNKRLLSINQDPMGIQGQRVNKMDNIELWTKPIKPLGHFAFAILNFDDGGGPKEVSTALASFGLLNEQGYNVTEAFDGRYIGKFKPLSIFSAMVNPTGIFMAVAVPLV